MYFDTLTLTAVSDELRAIIIGGRVQRVVLPNPLSIGLEIYARHQRYQLLASAHPQWARVHLVQNKLSRGVEQVTPLLLLLRKYVLGGRITAIEQPSLERILTLSIVKDGKLRNQPELSAIQADNVQEKTIVYDEEQNDSVTDLNDLSEENITDCDETLSILHCDLIIELMERRSNIILVDDNNVILDSVKRVTPRMSHRIIQPRQIYEAPPSQGKRDPRNATAAGMQALRDTGVSDVARALTASYSGVSPQAAREVVWRALGVVKATVNEELPWYSLAARLRELFGAPVEPTLVPDDEKPKAYAAYAISHLGPTLPQPTMSAALETFYAAHEAVTSHQQRRAAVQQKLDSARERLRTQYNHIEAEIARAQQLEQLRWEGEMLFAFMHTLTPGRHTLEVEGQTIQLDPTRSPIECAQERFQAYNKAKSALAGLPERLQTTATTLEGLEQLSALLELADSREQIDQIAVEAEEQGYIKADNATTHKLRRAPRIKILRLISSDGFDIYIGRSATQNDEVTFRIGRPEDVWLHARAIHGAHIIIRTEGRETPERTLYEAGGLAAYFSRSREDGAVDVDISRRSKVRKIAGGPPGLVTYHAEQTIRVRPLPPWS